MLKNKPQKGFTLIELLVVVAIISLLSSVVLGALNDARAKARDRAVVQGINQMKTALELHKSKYGSYPFGYININTLGVKSSGSITNENFLNEFIPRLPIPNKSGGYLGYYSNAAGNQWCSDQGTSILNNTKPAYVIRVNLETSFSNNFPTFCYNPGCSSPTFSCFSATN